MTVSEDQTIYLHVGGIVQIAKIFNLSLNLKHSPDDSKLFLFQVK